MFGGVPQAIINGLLLGGIYAAMAIGLSFVFGVMRIINIAHAAFALLCTYVAYHFFVRFGLDPFLSPLISIPFIVLLAGVVYRLLLRRLVVARAPALMTLLLLFGVANVFEGTLLMTFAGDFRSITPTYGRLPIEVGGLALQTVRLLGFLVSTAVVIALALYLKRTYVGKAIRATTQRRQAALLVGVNTERINLLAFVIGIATAAIGGTMLGLVFTFYPFTHFLWIGKLFCIVVLGGLGSLVGAYVGALILGVAETVTATFVATNWAEIVAYALLVLVLVFRPLGLFGKE